MSAVAHIDARIWQAVIAGAFVAFGWLVNGWQNRREAAALRAERMRDVHRALYAEIGSTLSNLSDEARIRGYADGMIDRMQGDADFVPFIPREHSDHVFAAIVADIHILPRQTIDPVVAYYGQIRAIAGMADDMRAPGFQSMSQDRRIAMYRDYIEMKVQALAYGRYANAIIAAYAKDGSAGADAEAARLNTRAADPSAP